jgi:preprotein translocase subunit SecD
MVSKNRLPLLWWVKFSLTILVLIFSLLFTLPTFINNSTLSEKPFFRYLQDHILPKAQILLGLDLKGGLSLTLDVDLDNSLKESLERSLVRVKERAKDDYILLRNAQVSAQYGYLIEVQEPKDAQKIVELVADQTDLVLFDEIKDHSVSFKANPKTIDSFRVEVMKQAMTTIRNRIDQFGVSEPNIFQESDRRIILELPGQHDIGRAKELIGNTAKLDFRLVLNDIPQEKLPLLLKEAAKALNLETAPVDSKLIAKCSDWLKANNKIPNHTTILIFNPYLKSKEYEKTEEETTTLDHVAPYLVEAHSKLTGELIENAKSFQSQENYMPEYAVSLTFKPLGSKIFGDLTREASAPDNTPHQVAIVLDDYIHSAPSVQGPILGGNARITMGGRMNLEEQKKESENLALVLRSGALPATVKVVEERQIGPSEGAENIQAGIQSSLMAAILVILIMVFIYGRAGLVANVAMLLNVFFILAVLALFGATLTLPGIAGLVLTMAIAVDGNVIINERIREEIRLGLSEKQAFMKGYKNSFVTLVDAHITTSVAGVILLIYGNPAVKGFAVTLLIGIVSTLFTSYYVTEVIGQWLVEKTKMKRFGI